MVKQQIIGGVTLEIHDFANQQRIYRPHARGNAQKPPGKGKKGPVLPARGAAGRVRRDRGVRAAQGAQGQRDG